MGPLDLQHSARFRRWEQRLRGWNVFPEPVKLEPPFEPFTHELPATPVIDDGRQPTVLSSLLGSLFRTTPMDSEPAKVPEPTPISYSREKVIELPIVAPRDFEFIDDAFEHFLHTLRFCSEPLAFEILATPTEIVMQLACSPADTAAIQRQLQGQFPRLVCVPEENRLTNAWEHSGTHYAAVDFGLAREALRPLAKLSHDLHVGIVSALGDLRSQEIALFQVLFQPVTHPWAESMLCSVTDWDQNARRSQLDNWHRATLNPRRVPFFANAPDLVDGMREKIGRPLYAVVPRMFACAPSEERLWKILRSIAAPLQVLARADGNEFIPLRNDGYPSEDHVDDVLLRQSRRAGMVLNLDELVALVHLPTRAVAHPKFTRETHKTKAAPDIATQPGGLILGENKHAGVTRTVRISADQRTRHVHIIGASGTGKSTLLFHMIRQDLEKGQGLALLDPHGDLVDQVLGVIPEERIGDVVLVDPSDEEFVVGFNLLEAHSEWEKNLLASDLVAIFRRLSSSWGDQMASVLHNAILAFLESERGGTLVDLRRFLLEPKFREEFLTSVHDPDVAYYWRHGFSQLGGNRSIGPVLTRLEAFLAPKMLRYMVAQTKNRIDLSSILDSGKILLARLSQGMIGRENAHLLGSLLVTKIHQAAMRRQRQEGSSRRDFWLYLDEFHNFITPSIAEILCGVRKYRLGLALAHHDLAQLQQESEVASAVLANAYTRVCFRVGDQDARALESGFSDFSAADLQNLGTGTACVRVERREFDFNLTSPPAPRSECFRDRAKVVRDQARATYAISRKLLEKSLRIPALPTAHLNTKPPEGHRNGTTVQSPSSAINSVPGAGPDGPPPMSPGQQPHLRSDSQRPGHVSQPTESGELPRDPGRGGVQHKAIQKRIKSGAETLGFRVTVEMPIPNGAGHIDLVLERGEHRIACEVTVTTTIDHEVGNVAKCLRAGFKHVVLIGMLPEKLSQLAHAVKMSLGPEFASRASFRLPDDFLQDLRSLPQLAPPSSKTMRVRGYRVKTTLVQVAPQDASSREAAMIQTVADAMRRVTGHEGVEADAPTK